MSRASRCLADRRWRSDGINFDHADWADATFEVVGASPKTLDAPKEEAVILTPKPPATAAHQRREGLRRPARLTLPVHHRRHRRPADARSPPRICRRASSSTPTTGHITGSARRTRANTSSRCAPGTPSARPTRKLQDRLRRHDRPHARPGLEQLELLRRRGHDRQSQGRGRRHGQQRPDQPRLDLHQHRRLLGGQARPPTTRPSRARSATRRAASCRTRGSPT